MTDEPVLRLELAGLPPLPNALASTTRGRMRDKKRWRDDATWAVRHAAKCVPGAYPRLQQAEVIYTRHSPAQPDYENLAFSFKPLQDGLVRAGVIPDDSPDHILASYRWEKAKKGEGKVTITVYRLHPAKRRALEALEAMPR